MAMTLVSTVEVGSGGAASIEFTNIPQTGKDLLVVVSGRSATNSLSDGVGLAFNNATTNFSHRILQGSGSAASSSSGTFAYIGLMNGNTSTSNTFSNIATYISNYTSSAAKSFSTDSVNENNATAADQMLIAHLWNNTAALTSIKLTSTDAANFAQHSTASLYIIS